MPVFLELRAQAHAKLKKTLKNKQVLGKVRCYQMHSTETRIQKSQWQSSGTMCDDGCDL